MDTSPDMRELRRDVDAAPKVWKEIPVSYLGDRLHYTYANGSAVKK